MSMNNRFDKYEEDENLIAATYLDPRFKNKLFTKSKDGFKTHLNTIHNFLFDTYTYKKIQRDLESYEENSSSDMEIEIRSVNEAVATEYDLLDFDSCLDNLLTSTESNVEIEPSESKVKLSRQSSSSSSAMKKELEKYFSLEIVTREMDPLLWWKANIAMFPELAKIANKMLSSQPSSIESERVFSIGGKIFTPQRNRLTPEIGEKLMLLNFNLRVLNFEY